MSTRAGIGIKNTDGTILATYLHNDGYVGHAGVILSGFYQTPEKAKALIELGNLSFLGQKIAPESETDASGQEYVTIAYHRDQNEKLEPAIEFQNEMDYIRHGLNRFGADYLYLFNDKGWAVYGKNISNEFVNLETVISEKLAE